MKQSAKIFGMSPCRHIIKDLWRPPIRKVRMVFRRKRKKKNAFSVRKWDPLFIIFEKHLYDFNYESRDLFLKNVVEEYVSHLVRQKAVIPPAWRQHLEKTLADEVSDMLVRKLYGCLTVEEFQKKAEEKPDLLATERRESRKRYQKLVS